MLVAWLHTTDRCNLRCAYCYLPHRRIDMSLPTGRKIIDTIFRSAVTHGYQRVMLKYGGGEPLLHFSLVDELHRYALLQADQQGLLLDGVLLSNGTLLTHRLAEQIQSLGLKLMISLDGLDDGHDCQRHDASGRGSVETVIRAIELAHLYRLSPHVSITVSGRNVRHLPAVISWVLGRDLPFNIHFYRENDLSRWQSDLRLEETALIAGMRAAFQVIEAHLPRRSLLASLVDHADLATPHEYTCGAGRHYLVFDPQGRLARCQMQMHYAVELGQAADPVEMIRASAAGMQNLPVDAKEECCSCEWKYWCIGGCPLTTYGATGRSDTLSPNCTIYKALYPEVMRLEQLRVLQYGVSRSLG